MIESAQVAVSTTAAKLSSSTDQVSGDTHSVIITAPSAAILYVGPLGVTSANGYPIPAGASLSLDLKFGDDVYGVLASGTGTASVLRSGV